MQKTGPEAPARLFENHPHLAIFLFGELQAAYEKALARRAR